MKVLWLEIQKHKGELMLALCAGLLLVQFVNISSYLVRNVDHQSVVSAADDDAGWIIRKAVKTRWWKDNGWVAYGPFYFRTAHTLQYFLGHTSNDGSIGAHEDWEQTAHFVLLFISLLSVFLFSLLIAMQLTSAWPHRLAMTSLLVSLGLTSDVWAEMLLRAHPDHMFALVCGLAFYFTLLWLNERENLKYMAVSAALWGVGLSVKLSVVLIGPAFAVLFFPPFNRARFKEMFQYAWIMVASYFVIGFPQTITLDRPFRFLFGQNKLSLPADRDSILGWWEAYSTQSWKILLAIAVLSFLLPRPEKIRKLSRLDTLRLAILVAFPTLNLMTRKVLVPSSHYAIPFLVMFFVLWAVLWSRSPRFRWSSQWWTPLLPLALMISTVGATPSVLQAKLTASLQCRYENREFYKKMVEWGKAGLKIWVDPYVPYDTSLPSSQQDVFWFKSWEVADRDGFQVFAFNTNFKSGYTGGLPSEYLRIENKNWEATKAFYDSFENADRVVSPAGRVFRKVYTDNCHHEVWQQE